MNYISINDSSQPININDILNVKNELFVLLQKIHIKTKIINENISKEQIILIIKNFLNFNKMVQEKLNSVIKSNISNLEKILSNSELSTLLKGINTKISILQNQTEQQQVRTREQLNQEIEKIVKKFPTFITNSMMLKEYNEKYSTLQIKYDNVGAKTEENMNTKIKKLLQTMFTKYNFLYIQNFNFSKLVQEDIKNAHIKKELDGVICIQIKGYKDVLYYYPLFIIETKNSLNLIIDNLEQVANFKSTTLTLKDEDKFIFNNKKILFNHFKDTQFIFCLPTQERYDLSNLTKIKINLFYKISHFIDQIKFDDIYDINLFTRYFYDCLKLLLDDKYNDETLKQLKETYSQKIKPDSIDNSLIQQKITVYKTYIAQSIENKKLLDDTINIENTMSSIESKIIDKVEDIDTIKQYIVSHDDQMIQKLYMGNQLDDVYNNVNKIISDFVAHIKSEQMTYLFIDNIESLTLAPSPVPAQSASSAASTAPAPAPAPAPSTLAQSAQSGAGDKYYYKYLKYKNKYLNYKI